MPVVFGNLGIPFEIPRLDHTLAVANGNVRTTVIPSQARYRGWVQIAKSEHLIVVGIPHVEWAVEGDGQDVSGGPLQQIQIEIVL